MRPLATALEEAGHRVWWDPAIEPGDPFAEVIAKALAEAEIVVVAWSAASVQSGWVRDEAGQGLRRKILVPVLIDDIEQPLGFGQVQAANLRDWSGEDGHPELVKLLKRLGKAAVPASAASPAPPPLVPPAAKPKRSRLPWLGGLAVLAIALVAGIAYFAFNDEWQARQEQRQQSDLNDRLLQLSNNTPLAKPYARDTLAKRYEGRRPDHIGSDFQGGRYYGTYRINASTTLSGFIGFLSKFHPDFAADLQKAGGVEAARKGSKSFAEAWVRLAADPAFDAAQSAFLERSSYQSLVSRIAAPPQEGGGGLGLDINRRSMAVQAAIFSIAVQYGSGTRLPFDALRPLGDLSKADDRRIIEALYAARSQVDRYFPDIRELKYIDLLIQRNRLELKDACHASGSLALSSPSWRPRFRQARRQCLARWARQSTKRRAAARPCSRSRSPARPAGLARPIPRARPWSWGSRSTAAAMRRPAQPPTSKAPATCAPRGAKANPDKRKRILLRDEDGPKYDFAVKDVNVPQGTSRAVLRFEAPLADVQNFNYLLFAVWRKSEVRRATGRTAMRAPAARSMATWSAAATPRLSTSTPASN